MDNELPRLLKNRMFIASALYVGVALFGVRMIQYLFLYRAGTYGTPDNVYLMFLYFIIIPCSLALFGVALLGMIKLYLDIFQQKTSSVSGKITKAWVSKAFINPEETDSLKDSVKKDAKNFGRFIAAKFKGTTTDPHFRNSYIIVNKKKYWFYPQVIAKLKKGRKVEIIQTKYKKIVLDII